MEQDEIKSALKRAPKGLTARELFDHCDSAADLNDVVKNLHAMKGDGTIRADGMRDSQVVYKVLAGADAKAAVVAPSPPPAKKDAGNVKHSASGLRAGLFDMLDLLRDGKVDARQAQAYANLSMTIVKSIEMQMQFEKMRQAGELSELGDMALVPALEEKE